MAEVLEELQRNYYLDTEDINVGEESDTAEKYDATHTPFLIFFNESKEIICSQTGMMNSNDILEIFMENKVSLVPKS